MLAQQHRMRASAQFSATTRSGARSGRRNLVLYTHKNAQEPTIVGFIVSKALGNAVDYAYPHDDPKGVVKQQYAPDPLADAEYYRPGTHGRERAMREHLATLRGIVRGIARGKRDGPTPK